MAPPDGRADAAPTIGATTPSERWRLIQRLVDGALDREPAERDAFLRHACGDDAALRDSAQRLLEACDRAATPDGLLAAPATALAAPMLAELAADDAAREREGRASAERALRAALAGRYAVERELGRGGMATVYLARDVRHERAVAVKVLARDVVSPAGAERFLREIRIAARLTHPNVLGVHDSGEADGLLWYVMPYVEGETLRARLAREGALPLADATRLLTELADALAYAHAQGVVHRDLKPENVLLSSGHAIVADFGIAKALASATRDGAAPGATLTATGMALGTPAYMAPEQIVGGAEVDQRSDLYALGVIAYEVLAGAHPFGARTPQAVVAAHLTEEPVALGARRADLPPALAALVARLLAKERAARPASAAEVLRELAGTPAAPVALPASATRRRRTALVAVAGLLAAAGAVGWGLSRGGADPGAIDPSGTAGATAIRTLAVLPFVNTGGSPDDEYFSDGLSDELAHALARLPGLRLAGRTSSYTFKGRNAVAREIGRTLDVEAYVAGTMRRAGERIRVTAQLVSVADGKVLREAVSEGGSGDVFAVQDELTRTIVEAIAPALGARGAAPARSPPRGTTDQEAYDLYLRGRYHWTERGQANVTRAIALFRAATERDPGFARAHAGLAHAYGVVPAYFSRHDDSLGARIAASAERALALDSTLADAQLAGGLALEIRGRFAEAEARYRAAVALEPWNATARHWLGWLLLTRGRTAEAVAELRRASQLDPLAKSPASALAWGLAVAQRYGEAEAAARRVLALDSTFTLARWELGVVQALDGRPDDAVRTLERTLQWHPDAPGLRAALLFAYAAAGRWGDADRVRGELRRAADDPSRSHDVAFAELVFGNREPLVRLLAAERGDYLRMPVGGTFGCNPLLDPLWDDPRFRSLMRDVVVAPCPRLRSWPRPPRAGAPR